MSFIEDGNDEDFSTYVPYISSVTGHWYRDVYFVLNDSEKNKEFVQVDEEYEAISGERWTLYETDENGQYVLYKVDKNGNLGEKFIASLTKPQPSWYLIVGPVCV